eukprot:TRINITY_DN1094_c0_g1_i1.p1 TRINITY_DN1094_c0_g1~~TRINITY_DN1094_c0_g1_i1.p1  ORF type:complete len:271 (+),score=91.98 TRINITY_DN1094_c0_g1_i1:26-838(+)
MSFQGSNVPGTFPSLSLINSTTENETPHWSIIESEIFFEETQDHSTVDTRARPSPAAIRQQLMKEDDGLRSIFDTITAQLFKLQTEESLLVREIEELQMQRKKLLNIEDDVSDIPAHLHMLANDYDYDLVSSDNEEELLNAINEVLEDDGDEFDYDDLDFDIDEFDGLDEMDIEGDEADQDIDAFDAESDGTLDTAFVTDQQDHTEKEDLVPTDQQDDDPTEKEDLVPTDQQDDDPTEKEDLVQMTKMNSHTKQYRSQLYLTDTKKLNPE